jgi:hypothetical protein
MVGQARLAEGAGVPSPDIGTGCGKKIKETYT